MAYDYLGLVNDLNGRVNETQLTTSNFAAAAGFYSTAKTAINSSIRDLNQQAYQWPHNHVKYDETLVAGTNRYAFQTNTKTIDWGTFRVREDAALGNETQLLQHMDYDDYLKRYIDVEYTTSTTKRDTPLRVAQAPNLEYVLHPVPDKAYTLSYEYFQLPVDLVASTDVPSLPEAFRHVIGDGAMYYVYFFRGDIETADRIQAKFVKGIKNLRSIYVNSDYNYVRDTRLPDRGQRSSAAGGGSI